MQINLNLVLKSRKIVLGISESKENQYKIDQKKWVPNASDVEA
jgi:hypothetical protein